MYRIRYTPYVRFNFETENRLIVRNISKYPHAYIEADL